MGWRISEIWNELGRLEELIELALHKGGSIPASVAGTGFWRSLAGVLQPTASIGKQGQVAGVNAGGSDILWQAVWNTWTTVGGGVFTPSPDQTALLVDTTGPQTTITTPANPYDGQNLILYDYEGLAALNPIIISANVANDPLVTVDDPSNPGAVPGVSGHIAQQGMTAIFKYFASAHQWQLIAVTNPYIAAPNSWAQATWFIDQSNKSGAASDLNPGTARAKPLLTFKELIRRWGGTTAPTLTGATCTITFMSGSPDATDPIIIAALCNQCFLTVTADAPAATATGALAGVVANSIATNQALNATLPAGTVAGSLIQNTSRANSFARAFKNLGGNNWQISQPINPPALPATQPTPVQNNAWANGDTVNIFPPATNAVGSTAVFNLNIVKFAPQNIGVNAAFNNIPTLANLNCADTDVNGFGFDVVELARGCSYVNVSFSRTFSLNSNPLQLAFKTLFIGCDFANAGIGGNAFQLTNFAAGSWRTNTANWPMAATLDCGFMMFGTPTASDSIPVTGIGTVYVDGNFLRVSGTVAGQVLMSTTYNGGQPAVYGSGGVDSRTAWIYTNTAVASFPCAGGMTIRGVTTAYSALTTAGTTAWHQVALTPANVDAAAGAAGFGGYAVWPGVGCFTSGNSQP
jgi:hypothetical protein